MESRQDGRMSLEQFRLETRVSVKEARRLLDLPPRTFHRWHTKGLLIKGTSRRVRLECIYDRQELCTTVEAYDRLIKRMNGGR